MAAAVQAEFRNLGDRKLHWAIIVGQDDPPDGLWGWVTIEAHKWPAAVISRGPLAFATHDEAMVAGETAADALWITVNRQLAGR